MGNNGTVTGRLLPGVWWPAVSGFGVYKVNYSVSIGAAGGKFRCWIPELFFPVSSGDLPQLDLTFIVAGSGRMELWSPTLTTYRITPVSGG
jgi:hypothetical protein